MRTAPLLHRPLGRLALAIATLGAMAVAPAWAAGCLDRPPWRGVAPGVWVWPGQIADIATGNRAHVSSTVVLARVDGIVPPRVTVVDPGPHQGHGHAVLQAIRCQWPRFTLQVINTHAHAENVLANGALLSAPATVPATAGPTTATVIAATAITTQQMQRRCPDCLQSLTREVGDTVMAGTRISLPNRQISDGDQLMLTDRPWQVLELRDAHTLSDLALWEPERRTLIAGGLVYPRRLPELAQGSLAGWVSALDRLARLNPITVVGVAPGHAQDMRQTRQYLCDLSDAVWQAMDAGRTAGEAHTLALPAYAGWAGYTQRQPFNAQRAWRELEVRWMSGERPPCSTPDVAR